MNRTRTVLTALITLPLMAAAHLAAGAAPAARSPDPAPITPPTLRLDHRAQPTGYAVDLTLSPAAERFSGRVEIELQLRKPTRLLWLNGTGLTIDSAQLLTGRGGAAVAARVVPGNDDFIGFALDRPCGPGTARLRITYQGPLSEKENHGLFRRKVGQDWYVFSQFEAIDARRAFPCFDEPGFKTPWQLTLHVPRDLRAFSNTPVLSEAKNPDGMKAVRFRPTRPLPSYLIALAVGPFDTVTAGAVGTKHTPVRIITPRGLAAQAATAARTTPELLTRLEAYFGIPYPYEKLDLIAIPEFGGAMENAGLITFAQDILLARPQDQTPAFQRSFASVAAHELSHQWFGDLVTMAWWDEIWLNESFASWMAPKIVDQWKPEWHRKADDLLWGSGGAMGADCLATARCIRQPIQTKDDIQNAFDGITYSKGDAVLSMFESWLGEATFQRGVRRYLTRHAWGNATADDFVQSLTQVSGQDMRPAFSSFLDRTGVPLVSVRLVEQKGKGPRLLLTQRRYLPIGSQASAAQTWQVPLVIKYCRGETVHQARCLLTRPAGEVTLSAGAGPVRWVLANAGLTGYYRVRYPSELLGRLVRDGSPHLTPLERGGLLNELGSLVEGGHFPVGAALALLPPLTTHADRRVTEASLSLVIGLRELVPEALRSQYARFIRDTYGAKAAALGWNPRPKEDEETRLLRPMLVGTVANHGEDLSLVREARRLTDRWLTDHRTLEAEELFPVLAAAARHGDQALFERFHSAARTTEDLRERGGLLAMLGVFRDPAILQAALHLVLTDEFPIQQSMGILWSASSDPETRRLSSEFVRQNFDALVAKLPREDAVYLIYLGVGPPGPGQAKEVQSFFGERAKQLLGGPRILAQALEGIQLADAYRAVQRPSLIDFLRSYKVRGTAQREAGVTQ